MLVNNLSISILARSLTWQRFYLCSFCVYLPNIWYVRYGDDTVQASSSPRTSSSSTLTSSSGWAGLSRLSQEDIMQIAMAVAGLIRSLPVSGTQLSSLSANPLQVSSSSAASSGTLVSTLPSSSTLPSRPGTSLF